MKQTIQTFRISLLFLATLLVGCWTCSPSENAEPIVPAPPQNYPVQVWTTSPDQSRLLSKSTIDFAKAKDDRFPVVEIDAGQTYQTVEGFGYTLTGGSAFLLHQLAGADRAKLLRELFGKDDNSLAVSYLRLSLGASDLDVEVFSYDDLPTGQTDPKLLHFNLSKDTLHLIPILKEILAIRPEIKLMASPWSAPVWMKTTGSSKGGSLKPAFYPVYAQYFVKYVQAMQAQGIAIEAVTVQNEPQHGGNNPSMVMSATEQADFVKNHLGPAFQAAGIATKIIVWDHNCDNPGFPIAILDDPAAKAYVHGSAFHLYAGEPAAMSQVHAAHPDRALYFTEQWTGAKGEFGGDLQWHVKNVVIGTMRNWSQTALEWNLANDPNFEPHTPGGCTECKGALTIVGASVASRNVSYFVIGHASKFVPPGSVRVGSNLLAQLPNVAFVTPQGKTVMIALNESSQAVSFNIHAGGRWMVATLQAGTVGTFSW